MIKGLYFTGTAVRSVTLPTKPILFLDFLMGREDVVLYNHSCFFCATLDLQGLSMLVFFYLETSVAQGTFLENNVTFSLP